MKKVFFLLVTSLLGWGSSHFLLANETAELEQVQTEEIYGDSEEKLFSESPVDNTKLELGVDTSIRYDSNVDLVSANEEDGVSVTVSPHIRYWLIGDRLTEHQLQLFYNPTLGYSSDDNQFNADHLASGKYIYDSGPVFLDLNGAFEYVSGNNTRDFFDQQTAQLLREERRTVVYRYQTEAEFEYEYSPLLTLRLNPHFRHFDYRKGLSDLTEGGVNTTLYYTFASKQARIGPEFGYSHVSSQNNLEQDVFRGGVRLEWDYSEMTTFYAFVGADHRDFDGGSTSTDPVGSFGVDWIPDPFFKASFSYNRQITPSASLVNQNYTADSLSVALFKKFYEHYFANFKGSYTWSDYDANRRGVSARRNDEYWTLYGDAGRMLFDEHAKLSIFYSFVRNDSNVRGADFDNHSTGVQFTWDL